MSKQSVELSLKRHVTMRLDADVIERFKECAQGRWCQSEMEGGWVGVRANWY